MVVQCQQLVFTAGAEEDERIARSGLYLRLAPSADTLMLEWKQITKPGKQLPVLTALNAHAPITSPVARAFFSFSNKVLLIYGV